MQGLALNLEKGGVGAVANDAQQLEALEVGGARRGLFARRKEAIVRVQRRDGEDRKRVPLSGGEAL